MRDGQRIAHFEVLEKLGAGGTGVVYKARDVQLDRLVALKVLPPARAGDEKMRVRLLREARAALPAFWLDKYEVTNRHEMGDIAVFPPELMRAALDWLDKYLGPVKQNTGKAGSEPH